MYVKKMTYPNFSLEQGGFTHRKFYPFSRYLIIFLVYLKSYEMPLLLDTRHSSSPASDKRV